MGKIDNNEVIQPQVPLRLPCYTLGPSLLTRHAWIRLSPIVQYSPLLPARHALPLGRLTVRVRWYFKDGSTRTGAGPQSLPPILHMPTPMLKATVKVGLTAGTRTFTGNSISLPCGLGDHLHGANWLGAGQGVVSATQLPSR